MRLLLTAPSLATVAVAATLAIAPTTAIATTAGASGVTATAGTTGQKVSPSLAALRAKAIGAIDTRFVALARDDQAIAGAKHLTKTDRATLENVITRDDAGLAALRAAISGATTRKQVTADYKTILTGYRVFLLLQPQIHDVIAADSIIADAATLTKEAASLNAKLSTPGPITAEESGDIATAKTDAASAATAVNAEVAAVVALIPAEVTKTLKPAELAAAKADNVAARGDLHAAQTALAAARSAAATPATTSPSPASTATPSPS